MCGISLFAKGSADPFERNSIFFQSLRAGQFGHAGDPDKPGLGNIQGKSYGDITNFSRAEIWALLVREKW